MTAALGYLLAIIAVMIVCGAVAVLQPAQAVLVVGLGSTVCVGLFNTLQSVLAAERAEKKTDEVANALVNVADKQDKKLTEIHTLVNSNMGAQLQVSMTALQKVAALTQAPEDALLAATAEELFNEHTAKQARVDATNAISSVT